MKKAQIKHMFTFIIAILVVGAIALIGTRSIMGIMNDKCNVDQITFKNEIETALANNNGYMAVSQESYSAPCSYDLVCLVDNRAIVEQKETLQYDFPQDTITQTPSHVDFFISQSVADGVTNTVFLATSEEIKPIAYNPNLRLEEGADVLCIPSSAGHFKMTMKGQGRTTLVLPTQ